MADINTIMAELAQYNRMAEDIAAQYTKTTETKRFTFA